MAAGLQGWHLEVAAADPPLLPCSAQLCTDPGWSRAPGLVTVQGLSRSFHRANKIKTAKNKIKAAQKELQEVCCSPSPWNKPHWLPYPRLCCYPHPQPGSPALSCHISMGCDTFCIDSLNP